MMGLPEPQLTAAVLAPLVEGLELTFLHWTPPPPPPPPPAPSGAHIHVHAPWIHARLVDGAYTAVIAQDLLLMLQQLPVSTERLESQAVEGSWRRVGVLLQLIACMPVHCVTVGGFYCPCKMRPKGLELAWLLASRAASPEGHVSQVAGRLSTASVLIPIPIIPPPPPPPPPSLSLGPCACSMYEIPQLC